MPEKIPSPEVAPYDAFEALVAKGEWTADTEEKLQALFESHESDLYMIYLNYKESGLAEELSEYERKLFEWLRETFEHTADSA